MENTAYRFAIYSTPITFPLCFAVHTWIVLQSPEFGVHRYEIHCYKNTQSGNYFYINSVPEKQGMPVFGFLNYWQSSLKFNSSKIYELSGDEAHEIVLRLENEIQTYPHFNTYVLSPGPNSNTFTQWVIEKAGLAKRVQLPWNAFGKKFLL